MDQIDQICFHLVFSDHFGTLARQHSKPQPWPHAPVTLKPQGGGAQCFLSVWQFSEFPLEWTRNCWSEQTWRYTSSGYILHIAADFCFDHLKSCLMPGNLILKGRKRFLVRTWVFLECDHQCYTAFWSQLLYDFTWVHWVLVAGPALCSIPGGPGRPGPRSTRRSSARIIIGRAFDLPGGSNGMKLM